jgi:Domain of unknown function (DUF3560)
MIIIKHTHQDGTLIEGSRKGDGVYQVLRGSDPSWWYFRSLGQIGLKHSRDKPARTWVLRAAEEALKEAGYDVAVEIDNSTRRSFADAEAERYQLAEERAGRYDEYAGNAAERSDAALSRARALGRRFEGGQPILVGHHSEAGARRDQKRMWDAEERGHAEHGKSRYWAGRAAAAERLKDSRESVPVTLRRIAKLEAEARSIQRSLARTRTLPGDGTPADAAGQDRENLLIRAGDVDEELAYWREHVAARQAGGVKIWSRDDFTRGDFVRFGGHRTWYEVIRVNPKSVTIPAMIAGPGRAGRCYARQTALTAGPTQSRTTRSPGGSPVMR